MGTSAIDLSAGLEPVSQSQQDNNGIDLSAGMEPASPGPKAPVNPYAAPQGPGSVAPAPPAAAPGEATMQAAPKPSLFDRARGAVANSPIGRTLETYTPSVADALGLAPTESETARQEDKAEAGKWLEYHPIEGAKQAASGAMDLAESGALGAAPSGNIPMPNARPMQPVNNDLAAKGATNLIGGAMEVQKPLMAAAIAAAPIKMAAGYFAGVLAGYPADAVARHFNLTPNEQQLLHTIAFFVPTTAAEVMGLHGAMNPEVGRIVDARTGEQQGSVNLRGGVAGGRGFAAGVAKGEPGEYRGAVRVGPFRADVNIGKNGFGVNVGPHEAGKPLFGMPEGGAPEAGPAAPPPLPDPVSMISEEQTSAVVEAAARASKTEEVAGDMAAGIPPPKPPSVPLPEGMADGSLTAQTVDHLGGAIEILPPEQQAPAILEATHALAGWIDKVKTFYSGKDGEVVNADTPQKALKAATDIVNGEIDRRAEQKAAVEQQKQEQVAQQQQDAETARTEREATLEPTKPSEKTPAVDIPNTPMVQQARSILQSLPDNAPAAKLDQKLRDTLMLPTPVRKALVDEEVSRRAQIQETAAQEQMTGQPTPEGQKPEQIEKWIEGVKSGEEPFAHVQKETTYRPKDIEGLARTKVEGAKDASGTYYHDSSISGAEIRNAARKGTLEQLREKWLTDKAAQVETGGGETKPAEAETAKPEAETKPAQEQKPALPYEGVEGKKTTIHLADESSIPARYRLVEHDSLTPSHNGNTFQVNGSYPQEIQERRYESSKPEQMKVIGQEQDFKPELILNTDPTAQTGPPIVTSKPVTIDGVTYPAGTVLGGNSRVMTTERVYTNGAAQPYLQTLNDAHRSFGFPHEAHDEFRKPVVVREIEPPQTLEEMHRLGSLLNGSLTQALDEFDRAVSMGKQISPDTLNGIADLIRAASDGDSTATLNSVLNDPKSGRQIVRMLQNDGIITARNDGTFIDPSTKLLTAAARGWLGNALLANLLNSRDLMEKTPPSLKQKLLGAIGSISSITSTEDGWNIAPAMRQAAKEFGQLHRQTGMSPSDAVKQGGMFAERGPVVEALILNYDKPVQAVRKAFSTFTIGATEGRNPAGLLGFTETPQPYLDFNFAFGTELTAEQFNAEMAKLGTPEPDITDGIEQTAPTTVEQPKAEEPATETAIVPAEKPAAALDGEVLPPEKTAGPGPFIKGEKVKYKTNKGKVRDGEIAWVSPDGTKVRIKDGKYDFAKPIEDVQHIAAQSEAEPGPVPTTAVQPEAKPSEEPKAEVAADETLVDRLNQYFDRFQGPKNYNDLKKIVAEFDGKEPDQLRMKQAQEAYETMLTRIGSGIVNEAHGGQHEVFDRLVNLYEGQPNLSIRTSTSISNQAYSTPLPLAFIADKFAGVNFKSGSVYEPTAGNGALLIGANPERTFANEIDPNRIQNLRDEGFKVTTHDATEWAPTQKFDSIVTNPPFGTLPGPVEVDGYQIAKLEHLIALKALSTMKDHGKATIIIGASKEPGAVTSTAKPFFNYLYSHYNVVADFELDGDLYTRQGASWPVRVIAIDGRARSAKFSPQAGSIDRLSTWGDVYERASQHLGANLEGQRRADTEPAGAVRGEGAGPEEVSLLPGRSSGLTHQGESETSADGYRGTIGTGQPGPIVSTGTVRTPGVGSPDNAVASDGDVAASDRLAEDQPRPKAVRREPAKFAGHSADASVIADEGGNQFQNVYTPFSEKKDVNVLAPKAMVPAMQRAMEALSDKIGDLDQFVADELDYSSVEEMQKAYMGLQVDTIAAGINAIQNHKAIIIADQTGIGKGRQAAAIIRYAVRRGYIPIFVTAKPNLFSDMYGDLHDIGSGSEVNPLLMNADAEITHPVTGAKVLGNPGGKMGPTFQRILETGNLPAGRNSLFLTYSQINKTGNTQQKVLARLADKAVFILDESHSAGGMSNTGNFMRDVVSHSQGTVFLSATYAKRPDNLPLYADTTSIGIAIPDKERIVAAITAGGAPLQSVVSYQLAQAGELFRRERSFDGIEMRDHVAYERQEEHEKISDEVTEVLRAIVAADAAFHHSDFADIKDEVEGETGGTVIKGGNQASKTVSHGEFTSVVHNLVKQLLLGLKIDDVADKVIQDIKDGKKPIVVVENTMGSFLKYYAEQNNLTKGAPLHNFNYSTILQRALDRTRYYNLKDEKGNAERVEVALGQLSEETQIMYGMAQKLIGNLNVNVPVSPIDWYRHRIEAAGFRVAEITGRDLAIDYSGEVPVLSEVPSTEKNDRVASISGYNNGGIDTLIINQAGSTGLSAHASEKVRDQRTRIMYTVQPAADINVYMQTLGRVNRTGQVRLPEYENFAAALPSEIRPAMAQSKKMKSLNANVSSNTRSALSSEKTPDMLNKYGDMVVQEYLNENLQMAKALHMHTKDDDDEADVDVARKATGRAALLPVAEQKEFFAAITERYVDFINYLDDTGQNDLEPKTYDFDAKEKYREAIYKGTDPSSPFGQDAHLVVYNIKRQGKPYTPEEVQQQITEGLNGAPDAFQHHRDVVAQLEKAFKPFLERQGSQGALDRAQQTKVGTTSTLGSYRIGAGLRVEINGENYNAVVTNIEPAKKPAGNPFAISAIRFTLAVNGPMRSIKISGSELLKILITHLGLHPNVKDLFYEANPDGRMEARVITGNLLGAYGQLKGVKARIVSFTKHDGGSEIGILLPKKFDMKQNVVNDYCLRTPEAALKTVQAYSSAGPAISAPGGDVTVQENPLGGLQIRTKTSKAAGGKYFLDPKLLGMVEGGEFYSQGGMMRGNVLKGQELPALRLLMGKGALYVTSSMIDQAREFDEKQSEAGKLPEPPEPPKGGGNGNGNGNGKALLQGGRDAVLPNQPSQRATELDSHEREMLGIIDGRGWKNSEDLIYHMGENDTQQRQYNEALSRLVSKGLVERKHNSEWGTDFRRTPEGTAAFKQKPSLGDLARGQEGSVDPQAIADYAGKAIPATWDELKKFVGSSGKSAKQIGYELAAAFAPASLADADAKDIMGHAIGEPALRLFQASQFLTGVKKMFDGMSPENQIEFVDRWQGGKKQTTPAMQQAQEFMESVLEQQRERENEAINFGRGEDDQISLEQKENYFPNRYSKPPSDQLLPTEFEQVARIGGMSRRPFEGNKAFTKQQRYTLKEAVAKGAVPLGSPVDMLMRRMQEGAKFVAAQYAMHNFKEQGIVSFLRNGKKMPDGYSDIEDKIAKVWRPVETEKGGKVFVQSGKWVGQKDAMRLLNNYLSTDHIRDKEIGKAFIKLKNVTTEMRLALSPFHFGYITVENLASGLNIGLDKFYNQGVRDLSGSKMAEGLEDIGRAVITPFTAVKVGGQMLKYARNPDEFLTSPEGERFVRAYPDFPRLQDLLFRGGLRWGMADTFKSSFGDGFVQAMQQGELGKSILKSIPWVTHTLMRPLFEHYIPRSKWAFAVNLLAAKLSQYSQALAAGTITEETIAREVAATTDNRFGEFNWDSLYLHNTLRTGMQLAFRSATWKIGSWRGLTSAAHETFSSKAFDDRVFERIDEQERKYQWLRGVTQKLPQLGNNAGWLLSMGITVAVMGSVFSKLASHKWPWEWAEVAANGLPKWGTAALEAMHPRTGEVDSHGEPIRISFPTGLKDYEHGLSEPGRYVKGSLSDVTSNAWDTLQNKDAFGNYVYNPQDPIVKAFMQGFAYNLRGDFIPISASNYARQYGPQDVTSRIERASGMVGGAPRALDQTAALRKAVSEVKHEPHTPEDEEAYRLAKQQPPTRHQVLQAAREKNFTYLEKIVLHDLSYSQAKDIYDNYATTQERQQLKGIMERKRTLEILKARKTVRR